MIPDDFFVLSKLTDSIIIGYFTGDIVNGSKVLLEIILNSNKSWKVLIRGKTVNPGKIGLDELYNLDSVFEIVCQMKYCRAVPEVVKSKENLAYLKDFISKVGYENSSEVCFRSNSCTQILPFKTANIISDTCLYCKKLQKSNKSETENTCTVDITKQDIQSIQQVTVSNSLSEMALPDENDVTLCENDDNDMSIILNKIFPDCPDKMKTFLFSQKMALERHPNGRRWNRDIVRLCLSLWCRSPHGYTDLRNSKFVFLPSQKLLQRYKNQVDQESDFKKDIPVLHWMRNEAALKNIPPEGYEGGLIIDEMSIQPDLQFKKRGGDIQLIGFAECTPESLVFDQISSGKKQRILATHALQFLFLGFTGFRFPCAHFPSTTASGYELYLLLWEAVNMLSSFGFKVQYISMDGAQSNRDLFKLLIPDFCSLATVTCGFKNIYCYDNPKIFFIMDISHVVKKIRNNILKSGKVSHCKRHLMIDDKYIEWEHFKRAYLWDIASHPFPGHHKLTQEHIFLTPEAKMRNHLAEDILNSDMLHLMELYQKNLGNEGAFLNATIELLKCSD